MSKVRKINSEDNYNKPFPSMLRELIDKDSKLSQKEIASGVGVTRQTISAYQSGESVPDIYTLEKIVDFFNSKYNLNYSIDYWIGKETIYNGEKKENIYLSNSAIEKLKEYQKDKMLLFTIEIILRQKAFIKALSEYLISSNIGEIIEEVDFLSNFSKISLDLYPDKLDEKKYKYYDLLEILPRLNEYSKKKVSEYLLSNNDILFEYFYNQLELKNQLESINHNNENESSDSNMDYLSNEEQEHLYNESNLFLKKIYDFKNSDECKKLLNEYEEYKTKKVNNNEHKRDRKE